MDIQDRARGALVGLAVGDAVGTTLEFRPRDTYQHIDDMVGGGPFNLAPGEWTDDTSMALALADSLAAKNGLDTRDLMDRFVSWWRHGEYSVTGRCFDIGNTTRDALRRYEQTGNPIAGEASPDAAGNGSLMRLTPIAIWGTTTSEKAMRQAARAQSATTHAALQCLDACEGFTVILHAAINGASKDQVLQAANGIGTDPIGNILSGGWRHKVRDEIRSSGYVAHSLEAALWCVDQSDNFRDAILLAANLGNDADTTAAIAGQLAGALWGMNSIPTEWLTKIAWKDRLIEAADVLLASSKSTNLPEAQTGIAGSSHNETKRSSADYLRDLPETQASIKVLAMVHELHRRGYDHIDAFPYFYALGTWRCRITSAAFLDRDDTSRLEDEHRPLEVTYSSAQGFEAFGWKDGAELDPQHMANRFEDKYPQIVHAASGSDERYVRWFADLLEESKRGLLPAVFGDEETAPEHMPCTPPPRR